MASYGMSGLDIFQVDSLTLFDALRNVWMLCMVVCPIPYHNPSIHRTSFLANTLTCYSLISQTFCA